MIITIMCNVVIVEAGAIEFCRDLVGDDYSELIFLGDGKQSLGHSWLYPVGMKDEHDTVRHETTILLFHPPKMERMHPRSPRRQQQALQIEFAEGSRIVYGAEAKVYAKESARTRKATGKPA